MTDIVHVAGYDRCLRRGRQNLFNILQSHDDRAERSDRRTGGVDHDDIGAMIADGGTLYKLI